jgi:MFS transporter, DHA2 family, multidrug resistance protein
MTVAAAPSSWMGRANWTQSDRPLIGVIAVLLGAVISTLNTRITSFGLADLRGALGLGFDQGSWVGTVFTASQMVVAPAAAWMSTVLGARRVLAWTGTVFAVASLFPPLVHDYDTLIFLQLVRGLAVGAFIPAALGFILRSLPPRWWIWGIAAYAFRFTFSQNVGGAIEGFYSESGNWQWIFWQNVVLTPVVVLLVLISMPRRPVDRELLARTDWAGIAYAGMGFGLLYTALDQGNRLDWFSSGTINGLMLAGGLLVGAFFIQEGRFAYPLIHLRVLFTRNVALPAVLIGLYGFGSMAAAFVLPDYMTRVQGLRTLQIGDTLHWIAAPQLVLVPLVAILLRRIDARLLLMFGFAMIALGSWMDVGLTHDWANDDFISSQCVEAVGLAFAITALITFTVANITPPQAAAIAATLQTSRLFGNELGTGVMQTFVRVREQVHSNLLGLHIVSGAAATEGTAAALAVPFGNVATGAGHPTEQGIGVLAALVQREAYVLAYIDAFWLITGVTLAGILLVLLLRRPPPNPLTPPRIDL